MIVLFHVLTTSNQSVGDTTLTYKCLPIHVLWAGTIANTNEVSVQLNIFKVGSNIGKLISLDYQEVDGHLCMESEFVDT